MLSTRRRLLPLALLLVVGGAVAMAWADMDDATYRKTAAQAKQLGRKAGRYDEKLPLLRLLAKDDSRRATEVMFAWTRASHVLVAKTLEPEEEKRREDLDAYAARLLNKHGADGRGQWSDVEKSRYGKRKKAWQEARTNLEVEARVQQYMASAVGRVTAADALAYVAKEGVPMLLAERVHGALLEACLGRLLEGPPDAVDSAVLGILQRPLGPEAAVRALRWVGKHKPKNAALRLGPCLASESSAVKRTAVKVLTRLDDQRSVPLLIEGLKGASGLPAAEIEQLLQRFTGKTFSADHAAWKRWWSAEGEAWLAALDAAKRFDPLAMSSGVTFYGIQSPSKRVAFVLDRSGSMAVKAVWHAQKTPITGGAGKKSSAGKTRLEVAQTQLAMTINNLASDAFFTIIFYDYNVVVWKLPPQIIPATRANKAAAQKWFMPLEPGSATSLFDGLMKALEYAEELDPRAKAKEAKGAGSERIDTIFLLSDGAPTHFRGAELGDPYAKTAKGKAVYEAATEAAYQVFKKANSARGIVVHAIGVGQDHNEILMKKIARESGGKYVAVGMK